MSSRADSVLLRRPPRRWLRRLVAVAASVVALVLAVYGWAWLSLERSSIARAMTWMEADVGDQQRFPARSIPAGNNTSALPEAAEITIEALPVGAAWEGAGFDDFLRGTRHGMREDPHSVETLATLRPA